MSLKKLSKLSGATPPPGLNRLKISAISAPLVLILSVLRCACSSAAEIKPSLLASISSNERLNATTTSSGSSVVAIVVKYPTEMSEGSLSTGRLPINYKARWPELNIFVTSFVLNCFGVFICLSSYCELGGLLCFNAFAMPMQSQSQSQSQSSNPNPNLSGIPFSCEIEILHPFTLCV